MSVRLTLRLRPEQECFIDCIPQGQHRIAITVELADGVTDCRNGLVGHSGRAPKCENQAEHAGSVTHGSDAVESDDRRAVVAQNRLGQLDYSYQNGGNPAVRQGYQTLSGLRVCRRDARGRFTSWRKRA